MYFKLVHEGQVVKAIWFPTYETFGLSTRCDCMRISLLLMKILWKKVFHNGLLCRHFYSNLKIWWIFPILHLRSTMSQQGGSGGGITKGLGIYFLWAQMKDMDHMSCGHKFFSWSATCSACYACKTCKKLLKMRKSILFDFFNLFSHFKGPATGIIIHGSPPCTMGMLVQYHTHLARL